jgi:hypothetical protein
VRFAIEPLEAATACACSEDAYAVIMLGVWHYPRNTVLGHHSSTSLIHLNIKCSELCGYQVL